MTSPGMQEMERDSLNPVALESDFRLSEDEGFSDKSGSVSTENEVHVEIAGTGVVLIPENSCRGIYKHRTHPKGEGAYICMHKESCNKRVGGYHSKLREKHRAVSGYYKGVYDTNGNLKAAMHGSFLTKDEVDKIKNQAKASDRAQAKALSDINLDDVASISSPEGDKSPTLKPHNQADLLKMMQSLCARLDTMEKSQNNPTKKLSEKGQKLVEGILRTGKNSDLNTTSGNRTRTKSSSVNDRKLASAWDKSSEDESSISGLSIDSNKTSTSPDNSDYCREKPKPRRQRKSRGRKTQPKRLYAVAKGKGGSMSVGLYQESFNKISFLVEGRAKGRYRKVKTEEEGMNFINDYFKAKGIHRPKWIKTHSPHYPSLKKIQRHVGVSHTSSSDSMSDSDLSIDSSVQYKEHRTRKNRGYGTDSSSSADKAVKTNDYIGIDPSLGKENDLFNVSIKNVNGLEQGLGPSGIGKKTRHLLLEQMEDMTAYPRHSSTNATEGIGELVEAVTGFKHHEQEKLGGSSDTGWKHKNRNVLGSVKSATDLNNILSYLLEEQHTILETCAGNMESVLLNAHIGSDLATQMVASSLGFRISRDTLHAYFSLLNHLAGVNSTAGWELCKEQLTHHSEKIGLICNKYCSRLQMVCKIYIYLREGQSKNWMSLKLHTAQLNSLTKLLTASNAGATGAGNSSGYGPCSHCKTTLHGGGKNSCPWKDESSVEAKKKAKTVLVQMGTSSG